PHGYFAHTPEPLSKNLKQIEEAVKQHKADIGFATDPDVDRLAIIDETGNCIGEEFSLLLSEKFILSTLQKNNIKLNDIVTNLSSSMASEDIANEYGINVIRTKVGEINVGNTMKAIKSPVGGEGNGGIICPDVHYTRDAIAGMALILAYMAQTNKKISTLCNQIPHYYFAKSKIETNKDLLDNIMKKAEIAFLDNNNFDVVKIDKTDGIKIILTKAWIHIRKSGTEPIIRVYVEAESTEKAEQLCSDAKTLLTN
ncbi:MAG: phosphoglucosamine mutase, partial [Candidatus Cloacimonetes bacterium]|nr:phosphoglucosamine mutase [Candidatus Cloacimonadota bacterium]